MLFSDVIAAVLVTAVIAMHDDPSEWRRLPSALQGLPLVAITTRIRMGRIVQAISSTVLCVVVVGTGLREAWKRHIT